MTTEELIKEINTFEWGYEMSDSHSLWQKYNSKQIKIENALKGLSIEDLKALKKNLTSLGKANYKRYFKRTIEKQK